jgi:hypothetical protein
MRSTIRLFLKGQGGSLVAAGVLLFLASASQALTWGEVNQSLERVSILTKEATALIQEIKIADIRDVKSVKKAGAQVKKAEEKLEQVIDIYKNLAYFDIPKADVSPVILNAYKSAIPSNLAKAKGCLRQAEQLHANLGGETFRGSGLTRPKIHLIKPLNAAAIHGTLVIDLRDLNYWTTFLQKRLLSQKLQ